MARKPATPFDALLRAVPAALPRTGSRRVVVCGQEVDPTTTDLGKLALQLTHDTEAAAHLLRGLQKTNDSLRVERWHAKNPGMAAVYRERYRQRHAEDVRERNRKARRKHYYAHIEAEREASRERARAKAAAKRNQTTTNEGPSQP